MYGRMFILLLIALFTARVVFNTLGIEDYGTYSVVGSIIVFFSFINRGLNSSTSRYITADIADGNIEKGRKTFNVCLQAHMLIAAIIIILAETVGLWCVNYILKIPEGREVAANIVYQFSVFSAVLAVMQSPYGATITAYERMDIYSYFSIVEVIMKLAVIYLVRALTGDKLIIYSILLFCTGLISISFYRIFAIKSFKICKFEWQKDKVLLVDIFKFMTWSTLGQAMVVGANQGASVLVNVYHSVVANAAMGVSGAITSTVSDFVVNFQTAFRPQITKSYVTKEYDYLQNLMIRASKISSFLVILFLVPILYEVENVLTIWLGEGYPSLSPAFCRWTLIGIYFEAISAPLWMIMYAQTNIRNYQIVWWLANILVRSCSLSDNRGKMRSVFCPYICSIVLHKDYFPSILITDMASSSSWWRYIHNGCFCHNYRNRFTFYTLWYFPACMRCYNHLNNGIDSPYLLCRS